MQRKESLIKMLNSNTHNSHFALMLIAYLFSRKHSNACKIIDNFIRNLLAVEMVIMRYQKVVIEAVSHECVKHFVCQRAGEEAFI